MRKIVIVIPAHNEERTLVETLPSLLGAIRHLKSHRPEIDVKIRVGADGCKDRTVEIVRGFGVEAVDSPVSRGKWRTVHELVRTSDADWIVLSDSGILWPENFLTACVPHCERPDTYGVAPTYRNPTAGAVENVIWGMECALKKMENVAGGPVSVHGPTVMYRKAQLLEAFDSLSRQGKTWINDDVAISLYLRLTRPDERIEYVTEVASYDCAESHLEASGAPIREYNRRKRMVLGNIQWLTLILAPHWRRNPKAALIAMRRVFRVIWAYWIAAFVVTTAFGLGPIWFLGLSAAGAAAGIAVIGLRPLRMLLDAGCVSLLAPYYLVTGQGLAKWK